MPFESDPIAAKLNTLFFSEGPYSWNWDDRLKPAEQAIVAIWVLEQEVYNGGFLQYRRNMGDQCAPVVEQLRKIGQPNAAAIVERALSLVAAHASGPKFVPISSLPVAVQDQLTRCERDFCASLDAVNAALYDYVSRRRDEIDAPEGFWTEARIQ